MMNKLRKYLSAKLFMLLIMGIISWAGPAISAPAAKNWQQNWDKIVSEAKKEGVVVICSSASAQIRSDFSKAFTGKYGVKLEFILGKPAELVPKIQIERRAGIYASDLFMAGTGTVVPSLGPEGGLKPLETVLLLPEVTEGKNWWSEELLWSDPNHFQVVFFAFPQEVLTINTSLVKAGEIKSYRDLLDPKWMGKMSFLDPRIAGSGNSFFTMAAELKSLGLDYLRALEKQKLVFSRDSRLLLEWLSRGKYPIALGAQPEYITEFVKAGAPISRAPVAEGTYLTGAGGGLAVFNNAPHPNAAVLFANWLLSKEGQIVASKGFGAQSARKDVPTEFLEPTTVRQPGVKYYSLIGEGMETKKREYMKLAAEMWGNLLQ